MKLSCFVSELLLSRTVASGSVVQPDSWVGRHTARCPHCRAFLASLEELAQVLPQAMEAPAAPEDCAARIMAAVVSSDQCTSPKPARAMRSALSIALGVAVAALAGFIVWHGSGVAPTPDRDRMPQAIQTARNALAVDPDAGAKSHTAKTSTKSQSQPAVKPQSTGEGSSGRVTKKNSNEALIRLLARSQRKLAAAPKNAKAANIAPTTDSAVTGRAESVQMASATETLAQIGAYYEANADYRRAAAAYTWASESSGDASVRFAAGRTAEAVGDVALAVEHYRKLLEEPRAGTVVGAKGGKE